VAPHLGDELRAPFRHYIAYCGLWQNWTMFHTIPSFRAIRPRLVARHVAGGETVHEAMLPGLARYESRTRIASLFMRYTWATPDIEPFLRVYLARACAEIKRQTGRAPVTVTLRLDSMRLNTLEQTRERGVAGTRTHNFSSVNVSCR
jgi:hypothetical protein